MENVEDALLLSLKAITRLHLKNSIEVIEKLDEVVRDNKWENEQWFLDWQDKLNEISVK